MNCQDLVDRLKRLAERWSEEGSWKCADDLLDLLDEVLSGKDGGAEERGIKGLFYGVPGARKEVTANNGD